MNGLNTLKAEREEHRKEKKERSKYMLYPDLRLIEAPVGSQF
jgi:hypothetical protein